MTTYLALDTEHGTYCPPTRGMLKIAREDAETSLELARQCGLKSANGWTPPPRRVEVRIRVDTLRTCDLCGVFLSPHQQRWCSPKCRKGERRKLGVGKFQRIPIAQMATKGIKQRMSMVSRRLRATPGDRTLLQEMGQLDAELRQRREQSRRAG